MNVKYALEKIENIVTDFEGKTADELLMSYSTIIAIISRIDDAVKDKMTPHYETYKHELLWSCDSLCGLDDGNALSSSDHINWALAAINKLKSVHCLNVK